MQQSKDARDQEVVGLRQQVASLRKELQHQRSTTEQRMVAAAKRESAVKQELERVQVRVVLCCVVLQCYVMCLQTHRNSNDCQC